MCLPVSTQESEDKDEQEQGAFLSSIYGDLQQAVGESICVRTVCWLHIFLSPHTDSVRLFGDLAVIHTQKYSLKLPKSDPAPGLAWSWCLYLCPFVAQRKSKLWALLAGETWWPVGLGLSIQEGTRRGQSWWCRTILVRWLVQMQVAGALSTLQCLGEEGSCAPSASSPA